MQGTFSNVTSSSTFYGSNGATFRFTVTARLLPPDDDGLAGARAVLKVPPDLPPDGLRAAYRQRLKEAHPDLGGSEHEVRRVIEAYKELTH